MPKHRQNHGIRKRCKCPRAIWGKCSHPWHFNFKWGGTSYRLSLEKEADHPIRTRDEARAEADRLRAAIRSRKYPALPETAAPASAPTALTFRQFAELWHQREGSRLASGPIDRYRLKLFNDFVLPGTAPPVMFGDKPVTGIALGDIEAWRETRRENQLSPVTINHDLKLLRKMLNWGIRKGYLERTPFKIGTEPAIQLDRETPRNRRFESDDTEQKLLDAAGPRLRAVVIALLETACRPGEILSLQWKNVSLERNEIIIAAEKAKTRTARIIPISSRLRAVLELRQFDPLGEKFGPEAFVFGDEVGCRVKSIQTAWRSACEAIGLTGFQLRDLRHEAGSRFEEAGIPITYVSKILGHTNLTTTSRYLNIHRRELHRMMQRFEEARTAAKPAVAHALHTDETRPLAVVPAADTTRTTQGRVS
jgi:integrase